MIIEKITNKYLQIILETQGIISNFFLQIQRQVSDRVSVKIQVSVPVSVEILVSAHLYSKVFSKPTYHLAKTTVQTRNNLRSLQKLYNLTKYSPYLEEYLQSMGMLSPFYHAEAFTVCEKKTLRQPGKAFMELSLLGHSNQCHSIQQPFSSIYRIFSPLRGWGKKTPGTSTGSSKNRIC